MTEHPESADCPNGSETPRAAGEAPHAGRGLCDVELLARAVRVRWAESGDFTPATLDRCGEVVERFARRLHHQGVTGPEEITADHCVGFIDAATIKGGPPELTTRHARRSALRMFFRTLRELGHPVGDPTLDIELPARSDRSARPLTDLEVTVGRASSRLTEAGSRSLQRAVCWALGETTAVTSEISAVRVGDVDDPRAPRWVRDTVPDGETRSALGPSHPAREVAPTRVMTPQSQGVPCGFGSRYEPRAGPHLGFGPLAGGGLAGGGGIIDQACDGSELVEKVPDGSAVGTSAPLASLNQTVPSKSVNCRATWTGGI